jgi:arylsulfatase A-like enzyme
MSEGERNKVVQFGEQSDEKISVFVCGAQKGGTTSLFGYFCEHPDLQQPDRKELHFFDDEDIDWANPDYGRLQSHFADPACGRLRFDITPIYSFWPNSLERLASYNPEAKLIFLFRDPYERAVSHWAMEFGRKFEHLDFSEAIREGRARLDGVECNAHPWRVFSYLERGQYSRQVERALQLFPREQLLFLRSEDLRDDHPAILEQIRMFLGISAFPEIAQKREHGRYATDRAVGPGPDDLSYIAQFVSADIERFKDLTKLDIANWPTQALTSSAKRAPSIKRSDSRPNILMIVADDLNSWVGALGRHPDVKTPAIDRLARRGTLFTKAYCAAPYCNASRMATFTGCLPSRTGVYHNETFWENPSRPPTAIELLREAGYSTFGAGKVFHGHYDYATAGREMSVQASWRGVEDRDTMWDTFVPCSDEPLPAERPLNKLHDFNDFEAVPPMYHHFDWGPLGDHQEASMPDELVYQTVSEFLRQEHDKPFFCAAGLYKPHLPWHVPQRFFDLYDKEKITLPVVKIDDLDDVPNEARKWALSPNDHELVTSKGQWRDAVQGYLAAISYCDWVVGRIVDALDRSGQADNTIIALWGDNGFHLGEKLHWRKFVLWEEATHVPMLIIPPAGRSANPYCDEPVSLMDIFPTIFSYCGFEMPSGKDGRSLAKAIDEGSYYGRPVVSSWGRGNHSVRYGPWRYSVYAAGGEELYHHPSDPKEWTNLGTDPRFTTTLQHLRKFLPFEP